MIPDLNYRYAPEEKLPSCCCVDNDFESGHHIDKAMYISVNNIVSPPRTQNTDQFSEDDSGRASVCTEEEMVAIEQLVRLKWKQIEDKSKEDIVTDLTNRSSVNNDLLIASSSTPISHPAPNLASAQTTSRIPILTETPLKNLPASSPYVGYSSSTEHDSNIFISIEVDEEDMISLNSDLDERLRPKIRTLSDVYSDTARRSMYATG